MPTLLDLPDEIFLCVILNHLDLGSALNLFSTCRRLSKFSRDLYMKKKHYETRFLTLVRLRRLHCFPIIVEKIVNVPMEDFMYHGFVSANRIHSCKDKRCRIMVNLVKEDYTEALKLVSENVMYIAQECRDVLSLVVKDYRYMSSGNLKWATEVLPNFSLTFRDVSNSFDKKEHKLDCIEFYINKYKPEISEVVQFFHSNGFILGSAFSNKDHYIKKANIYQNRVDLLYMLTEYYCSEFIELVKGFRRPRIADRITRFQMIYERYLLYFMHIEDTVGLVKIIELFGMKDEALMLSVEDLSCKSLEALLDNFEYDRSNILEYNENDLRQGVLINKIVGWGNIKALNIIVTKFGIERGFMRDVVSSSGNLDLMMDLSTPEEPIGYECSSFASAALF